METEKSTAIRTHLYEAETIRRYLFDNNILRNDLKIKKDNNYVYFPIKSIPKTLKSYKIKNNEFEKRTTKPTTYKEITTQQE